MRLERATAGLFARVVVVAERRQGVLTFADLIGIGCSQSWIARQVAAGRLHRLHRGVYSVVPPRLLQVEGRWLGAVLACGQAAVLSHTAAAALWDIRAIPSGPIHVTVPTLAGRSKREGIALHRSSTLLPSHGTIRRGIPVTKPARTIADLRRTLRRDQFAASLRRAQRLRLDIGTGFDDPDPDRNELERRFLAVCRRHGVPEPDTQVLIGPYTVDFCWPAERLVVETDGWETHGIRSAFEDDRARDAQLKLWGHEVVRVTWRQLRDEPAVVASVVRELLARRSARR